MDDAEARALEPRVVHVDEQNRIVKLGNDPAEPVPGSDQKRGDLSPPRRPSPTSAAATAAADNRSTCNNRRGSGPPAPRLMPLAMPNATVAAEHRAAAVAGDAGRPFHRHPGRRAGAAAQSRPAAHSRSARPSRSCSPSFRHNGRRNRRRGCSRRLRQLRTRAQRSGAAVGEEQRLGRIGADVDLHVLVGQRPTIRSNGRGTLLAVRRRR